MKSCVTIFIFIILTSILVNAQENIQGETTIGSTAVSETVRDIMSRQILGDHPVILKEAEKDLQYPDRHFLPVNPNSPLVSQTGVLTKINQQVNSPAVLTKALNFTGASFASTPTLYVPPDNMGAVGPTQYIVAINSRIITYNKTTGLADGALNADLDVFFSSVETIVKGSPAGTSDPHIRYDRLSKRWIIDIIDIPKASNRVLIAVSADSIITASTVFKFFYYQVTSGWVDYPTLGIDANAIYIGGNLFSTGSAFLGGFQLVVQKSSVLGNGPIVCTKFNLGTTSSGIYTAQGVDNLYDPSATEGYFIGVDATLGKLDLIRVTNPGSGSPTLTNVTLTIPVTAYPGILYSKSCSLNLNPDDDRLFAAMIRNGHLWTAHHIETTNAGVGSGSGTRISARWYDIVNYRTGSTLTLNQSGTVYSNLLTTTRDKNYCYPTITVNGQGHALMGFCSTGYYAYAQAGYTFRLSNGSAGTMQIPDSNTTSSTSYNYSGENTTHRWGDYSMTECDPSDDMTFWTIQQFCDATDSYGCRVTQLRAPAPPTFISVSPATIGPGANLSLVISGDTTTGLGFYEPGSGFSKHISASIDGNIVVNSITYNSPSTVVLNINTTAGTDGLRTITITNPDGQVISNNTLFTYNSLLPVELVSFQGQIIKNNQIKLSWSTSTEINSNKFELERSSGNSGWITVGTVYASGNSNTTKQYSLTDESNFHQGIYSYRLKEYDNDGKYKYFNTIEVNYNQLPDQFGLAQNYPNPFNPSTTISYSLPFTSMVRLNVYNAIGENVSQLFNGVQEAGYHDLNFNAASLPSGVYFYSIQTNSIDGIQSFSNTKKLMVLK